MGRARATRYAACRTLPGLPSHLPLFRISEEGRPERIRELHLLTGGRHWLAGADGAGELFEGLPPWAVDMSPQGYLGRTFSTRHPDLALPARVVDWSDDDQLLALARRGEDCVGNLVFGAESLDRWLAATPVHAGPHDYPALALDFARSQAGSSAGGEHPKFLVFSAGRHVLVKFAGRESAAERRWQDLLVCESLALAHVREAGLEAATSRWLDEGPFRFLEVERFDRVGARGRRGVLSLGAFDAEYAGAGGTWTHASARLQALGLLGAEDARRVRWLDSFGHLIGNTDRHPGNLALFSEPGSRTVRLAPVYDMLPMVFAPVGALLVERPYEPRPPTADVLDVWADAARHAAVYWQRVAGLEALSDDMRRRAEGCLTTLEALRARVGLG
jgi:hypothetical protein